jgi:hypothetical protein
VDKDILERVQEKAYLERCNELKQDMNERRRNHQDLELTYKTLTEERF